MNPLAIFAVIGGLFAASKASADGGVSPESAPIVEPDGVTYDPWTRYDASYQRIGSMYGVDWQWLKAFALVESDNGQNELVQNGEVSSDGLSYGLMQMTVTTAMGLDPSTTIQKLAQLEPDADFSISLAAQLISQNAREFPGQYVDPCWQEWVVKRYNGSHTSVNNQRLGVANGLNRNGDDIDVLLNRYWDRWQTKYQKVLANS